MYTTYFFFDGDTRPVQSDVRIKESLWFRIEKYRVQGGHDAGQWRSSSSWVHGQEAEKEEHCSAFLFHLFIRSDSQDGATHIQGVCDGWNGIPEYLVLRWWHCLGWFRSSGLSKRKCVTRAELDSLRTEGFEACSPWFLKMWLKMWTASCYFRHLILPLRHHWLASLWEGKPDNPSLL